MPFCIEHIGKFIKSLLLSNNMKTIIYEIPDTKREFRRYDVHAREIYNKIKVLSENIFDVPFFSQFKDITTEKWKKVGCGIAVTAEVFVIV